MNRAPFIAALMMLGAVLISAGLLLAPAAADPVAKRPSIDRCGPLPLMLDTLKTKWREFVVMTAMSGKAQVFLTFSDIGGFTVLIASDGLGCIVVSGVKAEFDRGT